MAAPVYHWHETKLYLDGGEDCMLLADRANNPAKFDVSQLYSEWQKKELGYNNGKGMLDQLQAEIRVYNDIRGKLGRKAREMIFCDSTSSLDRLRLEECP